MGISGLNGVNLFEGNAQKARLGFGGGAPTHFGGETKGVNRSNPSLMATLESYDNRNIGMNRDVSGYMGQEKLNYFA